VRKNAANASSSPARSATVPVTAALAPSTAQRRGTAVKVVRISPVPYSEVKTRTLRTLTGSTVYSAKARKLPVSAFIGPGGGGPCVDAIACATTKVAPIVTTAATSRVR